MSQESLRELMASGQEMRDAEGDQPSEKESEQTEHANAESREAGEEVRCHKHTGGQVG